MTGKNELELVGGHLNRTTVSEHFSKEAWRLLTTNRPNSQEAVARILENPEALEIITANADRLIAAIEPCGEDAVFDNLTRLATVYTPPWDDPAMARVALNRYFAVLVDFPLEALLRGLEDFDRSPEGRYGWPKPGMLVQLCEKHATTLRIAAGRARLAAGRLATKAPEKTDEEKARDRQKLIDDGIMTPDGKIAPLTFKPMPKPVYKPLDLANAEALKRVAEDPLLKRLKDDPIRRGPAAPPDAEFP